jgi:hypothetical protein
VNISSTASTSLTINKTIPNVLTGNETVTFTFHVAGQTATITFLAGETSKSTVVNGIVPGTYTVTEDPLTGWTTDSSKSADLTLPSHCTNSVTFNNTVPPATATATKVTDPAGGEAGWTFTLTRPDNSTLTGVTGAGGVIDWAGADGATTALTLEGQYTITETAKSGFTQVNAQGCTFTVNFPADSGHAFSCTITNRQDATLQIVKETAPADSGSDSFPFTSASTGVDPSFSLDTHAASVTPDSRTFTFSGALANYGSKAVTEGSTTGWTLTNVVCSKTNSTPGGSTATVNVQPGDHVVCTFTNKKDASLKIVKVTDPANSGADTFGFTSAALGPFTLDTNGADATNSDQKLVTFSGSGYGVKSVTESATTGWTLQTASCVGATDTDATLATVTVDVQPGDNVVCTYTNKSRGTVRVVKQINNAPLPAGADFLFELRLGDQHTQSTAPLESGHATGANGGVIDFAFPLVPGTTYAICELLQAGFNPTIIGYGPYNPADAANYWCWNFSITTTQAANTPSVTFAVENDHPQSKALTIGYWKNWNGCTKSKGNQADVLGQFLGGINLGTYTFTNSQADECKAVQTLSKSTFSGTKKASDPLFNMAAQLLAAKLNINAQAGVCSALIPALNGAEDLLDKYGWNGNTYSPSLTAADATLANGYATTLDKYNNNQLC